MKSSISKKILLSLATITALSLSSCGGGGGSSSTVATDTTTATAQNVTGKAIDGYLVKATVCLDLNMDNQCEIAGEVEPVTSTDENGSFSLTITAEQQKHKNFAVAPLLVYSGYDADTKADFTGKLRAVRGEGVINITPTTTVVESMVREQNLTHDEAKKSVREMMGLPEGTDLGADPVALAKGGDTKLLNANLKLQKNVEVLAEKMKKLDEQNKDTKKVLKTMNQLIDDLYLKIAQIGQKNDEFKFDKIFDTIIEEDEFFTPEFQEQAKIDVEVVGKKIYEFIGDEALLNTEHLGAKISGLQNFVIDGSVSIDEDGEVTIKDTNGKEIDDSYFEDIVLMHSFEILDIVKYNGNHYEKLAEEIAKVLKDAGMKDKYLPVEEEIKALKANPLTLKVGKVFERVTKAMLTPISDEIAQLLANKTLIADNVEDIYSITFSSDMEYMIVVTLDGTEEIVDIKISGNTLLIDEIDIEDGEYGIFAMKITNLSSALKDGFIVFEDDEGSEDRFYLTNIESGDENTNSTTEDAPITTLPTMNTNSTEDDSPLPSLDGIRG